MARARRPSDLGNDSMTIRTSKEGVLIKAVLLDNPDLTTVSGRKVAIRFAERLLDICEWFEAKDFGREVNT